MRSQNGHGATRRWQVRAEARNRREEVLAQVKSSPDITVKVNLFEDSAAMAGLILAALGVGLGQLTGSPVWDGAASIAIGALLVAVAIKLGMDSRDLLIGRAADPGVQQLIREELESRPGVDALLELRTMHMGPDSLIVAARVALSDELGADQAEDLADEIDRRLSERLPLQLNVFIDPTQTASAGPAARCHPPGVAMTGGKWPAEETCSCPEPGRAPRRRRWSSSKYCILAGWDIARATGQPFDCDAAALGEVESAVQHVRGGNNGELPGLFGPVVPVSGDASDLDRVLCLTGRNPAWSAK